MGWEIDLWHGMAAHTVLNYIAQMSKIESLTNSARSPRQLKLILEAAELAHRDLKACSGARLL
jgi:deoxyribose-phosphate aldolase